MGPSVEYHAKVSGFVIRGYLRVIFDKQNNPILPVFSATSVFSNFLFSIVTCNLRLLHL